MTRRFRSTTWPAPRRARRGVRRGARGEVARDRRRPTEKLFDQCRSEPVDLDHSGPRRCDSIDGSPPALADEIARHRRGRRPAGGRVAAINARTEMLAAVGAARRASARRWSCCRDGDAPVAVQTWDWYAALRRQLARVDDPARRTGAAHHRHRVRHRRQDRRQRAGARRAPQHPAPRPATAAGSACPCTCWPARVLDEAQRPEPRRSCGSPGARVSASSSLTLVAAAGGESAAVSVELNPGGVGYALPDADGVLRAHQPLPQPPGEPARHRATQRPGHRRPLRHAAPPTRRRPGRQPHRRPRTRLARTCSAGGGDLLSRRPVTARRGQFADPRHRRRWTSASGNLAAHAGGPCTVRGLRTNLKEKLSA